MHRGRVVAAGTVADVAGRGGMQLAVDDADRASAVLAAAGIAATAVPARRALEDVFLELVDDGGETR
jgi:ABC-2 type transport system ATP-binding protein